MHLLNEETMFMSWRRFAIKEINDWAQNDQKYILQIKLCAFNNIGQSQKCSHLPRKTQKYIARGQVR